MQNRLLADIGIELAKKPFEWMSWWSGLKWGDFIWMDPPLTIDNPLWSREESSLKKIRLFGVSPDELQAEIIHYWQQAFWKRWLLTLFTPIHRKIKVWTYYQRCRSFHKVCIKNPFDEKEPIAFIFEKCLGKEAIYGLNKCRIQVENYLGQHAGNLKWKNNNNVFMYRCFRKDWNFFKKLMQKKLARLSESDRNDLKSHLENEYRRLEDILSRYLYTLRKNISKLPSTRQGEHAQAMRSRGAPDRRALTGEAGNASRRHVMVVATARSPEWASAWWAPDESGLNISRVIRTNFGDTTAKIFREHSDSLASDESIKSDIFVDTSGQGTSCSIHSIEDWVKIKRQIIETMLQEESSVQFFQIKIFLESCFSKVKLFTNHQIKQYEKLIEKVIWRQLACPEAIQQMQTLQTDLIYFFKKSALLFHPDKSFGNEQLQEIQTELFKVFKQLSEESVKKIKESLQALKARLPLQSNSQEVQKMEQDFDLQVAELDQRINALTVKIEQIRAETEADLKQTRAKMEANSKQTRIEIEAVKVKIDKYVQSQVYSKLILRPPNDFIQEENEPQKNLPRYRRLARYTPVF
jgi:hypothetical protein